VSEPLGPDPARLLRQRAESCRVVELETSVRGGRVVVALLDLTGNDEVFSVQASVAAAVAGGTGSRRRVGTVGGRLAVRTARPGRGSAIAYWSRVIRRAVVALAGSPRGRVRG